MMLMMQNSMNKAEELYWKVQIDSETAQPIYKL